LGIRNCDAGFRVFANESAWIQQARPSRDNAKLGNLRNLVHLGAHFMGRSGSGNFDSDAAGDYVGELVARLVGEVEQAVTKPQSIEPDEYYGEIVPCIIEILAAVQRRCSTAAIPSPETIASWKLQFLAVRARSFGGKLPENDPRSKAISAAFDDLQQLSRQVHE
jgi:hypothetical protein